MKSLSHAQLLATPMDCSPPGSPIPGILQARTLEWIAISFSNVWKWKVKVKSLSRVRPLATPWTAAYQTPPSMGFSTLGPEKFCLVQVSKTRRADSAIWMCVYVCTRQTQIKLKNICRALTPVKNIWGTERSSETLDKRMRVYESTRMCL